MNGTVFHVLTETDSFSDTHGAALQRWVANVLRFEAEETVVACARGDASWDLPHVRRLHLSGLNYYSKLRGRYRLPWGVRRPLLRRVLRPIITALSPGCVVWIHNRPDYAGAIEKDVRAAGASLVVHLHNSLLVSFPSEVANSFRADKLVFCSNYLATEAASAFPKLDKMAVIHNGADENRFFPKVTPEGSQSNQVTPVVLFAGRLVPEKGAHVFVEAMWLLQARGVKVTGRLIGATGFGSSNGATAYSRKVMQHAPRNVEFGGYQSSRALAEEFRRASVFCSPSVWHEPFGLVNVEAMASGLPIVSTLGGGVPEVFAEGGAVLVARGSAVELADAIERVIRNKGLRLQLAADGYNSFHKNFTWRTVHHRYREVLSSLA